MFIINTKYPSSISSFLIQFMGPVHCKSCIRATSCNVRGHDEIIGKVVHSSHKVPDFSLCDKDHSQNMQNIVFCVMWYNGNCRKQFMLQLV